MDIKEFFKGKGVVISGVTGFIGKVLVEKIIYSCPDVKNVYVLIRKSNPRSKTIETEDRFEKLLTSRAFDRIRNERPNDLNKILPIWSDIVEPGLGISETDRETLIRNASIVFHSAASTRFMDPLKVTLKTNFFATKTLLSLFKEFDTKDAFIYFSTAFCNTHVPNIEERIYDLPVSTDFITEAYNNLSIDGMDSLFPKLSDGRVNSYFLSKAITENYLGNHCKGLPVAIVRPSIVGHSFAEPKPGWGDSNSYASTLALVIGHGLIHNVPLDGDLPMNIVPLDKVCNLSIAVAASLQRISDQHSGNDLPVYNCVADVSNQMTPDKIFGIVWKYKDIKPSTLLVCYPHISLTKNFIALKFGEIFHHYLPALSLDLLRKINGKKAKYYKLYRKFFTVVSEIDNVLQTKYVFMNTNSKTLYKQLTSEDQKTFNFDVVTMDLAEYLIVWVDGIREFFHPNEKIDYEKGKRKLNLLFWRYVFYEIFLAVGLTAMITIPFYKAMF